ncbi:ATP-binding protein [Streptomyces sp. NPDC001380]|uniref:ATP-binding protein n=1 Tax=Streptomyces sp. NPDC001380 TaxID=3364566 RepID=UPI0036A6FF5A
MSGTSIKAKGWVRTLPASAGARAGRQWTLRHLESLGWPDSDPETVDAVLLTVSELVTNAHVHAHSDAHLVLAWDSRCLHVSVGDSSPYLPAPREPDPARTSGRGLALIGALADTWNVHPTAEGKTVTACFIPSAPERPGERPGER